MYFKFTSQVAHREDIGSSTIRPGSRYLQVYHLHRLRTILALGKESSHQPRIALWGAGLVLVRNEEGLVNETTILIDYFRVCSIVQQS